MTVHFIGAGPGVADLITLRGRDLLARCPVCLYAGALVPREVLGYAPQTHVWLGEQAAARARAPRPTAGQHGALQPTLRDELTGQLNGHGLTRAVAVEYGATGITANAICPGAIETDLTRTAGAQAAAAAGITYEAFLESYSGLALTKQLNTVAEVAAVAVIGAGTVTTGAVVSTT